MKLEENYLNIWKWGTAFWGCSQKTIKCSCEEFFLNLIKWKYSSIQRYIWNNLTGITFDKNSSQRFVRMRDWRRKKHKENLKKPISN